MTPCPFTVTDQTHPRVNLILRRMLLWVWLALCHLVATRKHKLYVNSQISVWRKEKPTQLWLSGYRTLPSKFVSAPFEPLTLWGCIPRLLLRAALAVILTPSLISRVEILTRSPVTVYVCVPQTPAPAPSPPPPWHPQAYSLCWERWWFKTQK